MRGARAAKGKAEPLAIGARSDARASSGIDLRTRALRSSDGTTSWTSWSALWLARERVRAALVTVVGEPGIGKSRLVASSSRWSTPTGFIVWRQGRSLPYGEGSAFWGFAEIVKGQAGILESDGADGPSRRSLRLSETSSPTRPSGRGSSATSSR